MGRRSKIVYGGAIYATVAKRLGHKTELVRDVCDTMWDLMVTLIADEKRVDVSGFGQFLASTNKHGDTRVLFRQDKHAIENVRRAIEHRTPRIRDKRKRKIMISGFEDETTPLTEHEEKVILPLFVRGFANHVGKQNAVTSTYVAKSINKMGHLVSGGRIRKLVNHIRRKGLVPLLVADNKGYWVSNDPKEVKEYLLGLQQREEAIRAMRIALRTQAKSKWPHLDFQTTNT